MDEEQRKQVEELDLVSLSRLMKEAVEDQQRINKFLRLMKIVIPNDLQAGNLGAAAYDLSVAILSDRKMTFTDCNDPNNGELFRLLLMTLNNGDPILDNICLANGDAISIRDTA
jgi:hypothetical protein